MLVAAPALRAQVAVPLNVGQISITNVGPPAAGDALVRANIRVKEGDSYSRNSIDDDVRNLYATGFFLNVRVLEERVANKVNLTYVLQGKLKLTDILFTGNKEYSAAKLRKKVTSKVGDPLDERKAFADAEAIRTYYQKSGYPETKVKYVINPDERAGRGTLTYEITESTKRKLVDVTFDGAHAFKQSKLRKVVKTRRWWIFSWLTGSGVVKTEQLEDDQERLAEFYRNEGYIDFELKEVRTEDLSPKKLVLHFVLEEGRPYKVGAVGVQGNKLFSTAEILGKLKMGVGATFTPKALARDVETVQDLYGTKGYIDARVIPRRTPNTQTGTIDIQYLVEEGDKAYIEKIEIKGNTKTKDRVIRRELAVAPGEVFDMVKVRRSKERLEGLNYFERVETHPEPTDIKDHRNLVISVSEKNTGTVSLGAGFSTVDALVGFLEVTQGNFDLFNPPWFTGGGQKMRLRLALGTERQDYVLTFIEPWFTGRKLQFSTELYYRDLNYVSLEDLYDERIAGMRLGLTRALGSDFLIGGVSYTLENINIDLNPGLVPGVNVSEEIAQQAGDYLVSKVGASLAYDTRGGGFLPNRGQRTELRAELSGGPFGGDVNVYRLEARTAWYFPGFVKGHVLELGGRIGVADLYGDTTFVPIFDRWFLGGLDTLRGYEFHDVGPKDEFGEPLGGNTYWFATAEYSIPIIERVRLAVFYDAGMVYPQAYSFQPQTLVLTSSTSTTGSAFGQPVPVSVTTQTIFTTGTYNDNWGVGIRLNLPIGPLRLDYGIPIKADPRNDSSGRFQFSVGYTREF